MCGLNAPLMFASRLLVTCVTHTQTLTGQREFNDLRANYSIRPNKCTRISEMGVFISRTMHQFSAPIWWRREGRADSFWLHSVLACVNLALVYRFPCNLTNADWRALCEKLMQRGAFDLFENQVVLRHGILQDLSSSDGSKLPWFAYRLPSIYLLDFVIVLRVD